ncbi:hypothetical protein GGX14DRAFT_617194 [Mycena pura]|uniref:Short-chain dehydrogenase/reductase SDR n=1 Tax=Mycena pura TaxID=153505 RepID=A0AAD6YU70_9AGAR|nr:hypothetical protein GGX14DRAFT_617194 [Mycena pura]
MAKTAIVTGASSGIGRESAIELSKAGWNVVLTARRVDALRETASQCSSLYMVLPGDITDEVFVKKLFRETVAQFGRVDLLFNNAGVNSPAVALEDISLETFQTVISVNLVGPFLCAREAVRAFKAQTPIGGRIINNGSISAHTPRPMSAPYTMSKHAITGLSKCLALDGRAFDITCTQLDIGACITGPGVLQPDGSRAIESTFDVAHVAAAVVHLASLPPDVGVPHFTIMASKMPFAGRG